MNTYNPPPPPSFYANRSHGVRPGPVAAQPPPPPATPHSQQYRRSMNGGPIRPPPLDTSFIYNGPSSTHNNMQQPYQHHQPSYPQYPPNNNNNNAYPNTPAPTSRPQSMYQTPPSSNGISGSNNNEHNLRSRRISVTTGDNGWKVSSIGRSSTTLHHHHHQQQRPMATEKSSSSFEAGNGFNDRRMRRQSTGAAIIEHPITPAYTPRDSHYGYFSPTHATMSPQEHVAPTMPPQPINKRESFVGGFVIPPAYPPYRPQPQQYPPYTPSQPSHPQPQPQYPGPSPPSSSSSQQQQYAYSSNSYPHPHHQHTRSSSSFYVSNQQYGAAAGEITPPAGATDAEYSGAASEDNYPHPSYERARSVRSVRSVKSNKSMKSVGSTPGEAATTKQPPAKKRQITVRSINEGHRVWIDVAPNETGHSIAEKIHIIATFKTRKILSITTASGRQIRLDRKPLFDGWADIQKLEDGEEWHVEWAPLDKSMMDRFLSKMVQVGDGGSSSSSNNNNSNNSNSISSNATNNAACKNDNSNNNNNNNSNNATARNQLIK